MNMKRWLGGTALICFLLLIQSLPVLAAPDSARQDSSFSWVLVQEEGKGDKWLCRDGEGKAATGWIEYEGEVYFLNKNGIMVTGWVKDGGLWYYLDEGSGVLQTNTWIDNYYVDADGSMTKKK